MKKFDSEKIIVGEYTTAEGPQLDDHFLVIIDPAMNVQEYPTGSKDFDQILHRIEDILGFSIEFTLCDKTDFQSRVIYPKEFRSEKVFQFEELSKDKSIFKRLFSKKTLVRKINPTLLDYLKEE